MNLDRTPVYYSNGKTASEFDKPLKSKNTQPEVLTSSINDKKIAIVGCGFVGSSSAFALMNTGLFNEIVMIDVDNRRAEGEARDIADGVSFVSPTKVYAGTYEDAKDAAVIVVTAGCAQKDGETRLDLAARNVSIFSSILSSIEAVNFQGILLIVSNPVDVLTYYAHKNSSLPSSQIIGSGTTLDSSRLRYELAQRLSVDLRNIDAYFLGEHGDSSFIAWSSARIAGVPLQEFYHMRLYEAEDVLEQYKDTLEEQAALIPEVIAAKKTLDELFNGSYESFRHDVADSIRNAAYEIISRKKATYYGIAMSVVRLVRAIMNDEKTVLPVSNPYAGDVCLSTPCVIGRNGIEGYIPNTLSISELRYLDKSSNTLKATIEHVEKNH